jgi:hypothetical protein
VLLARLTWLVLAAVLVVNVPPFLCMGLDHDVTVFDLSARNVLWGGVHYRDVPDMNLPGMLWAHVAVRATLGWSSEAIRLIDLAIVTGIVGLLLTWLPADRRGLLKPVTALALAIFYFSTSEWCHCQRDTWMLLPALAALVVRRRQVGRLPEPDAKASSITGWSFIEGALWAASFWIKPFVVVPALVCWLVSVVLVARKARVRRIVLDTAGVLAGGLAAGAAGVAWMVQTGGWPFWLDCIRTWSPEYFQFDSTEGDRLLVIAGVLVRLFPWILIHLATVPLALETLWRAAIKRDEKATVPNALLAALYLGWLGQAVFLQHVFDYVQVPPLFLGLTLLACHWPGFRGTSLRAALGVCLVLFLVVRFPALVRQRLALWPRCFQEGSSAELRDRLSLYGMVDWQDLERVAGFLREQNVQDGEVCCYTLRTIPLYLSLDLKPSTEFTDLEMALLAFPRHRDEVRARVAASGQKYLVFDLWRLGVTREHFAAPDGAMPSFRQYNQQPFPWSERIIFRAGRYLVLRLSAAEMPLWLHASFGL